jgi:hypothetical protein
MDESDDSLEFGLPERFLTDTWMKNVHFTALPSTSTSPLISELEGLSIDLVLDRASRASDPLISIRVLGGSDPRAVGPATAIRKHSQDGQALRLAGVDRLFPAVSKTLHELGLQLASPFESQTADLILLPAGGCFDIAQSKDQVFHVVIRGEAKYQLSHGVDEVARDAPLGSFIYLPHGARGRLKTSTETWVLAFSYRLRSAIECLLHYLRQTASVMDQWNAPLPGAFDEGPGRDKCELALRELVASVSESLRTADASEIIRASLLADASRAANLEESYFEKDPAVTATVEARPDDGSEPRLQIHRPDQEAESIALKPKHLSTMSWLVSAGAPFTLADAKAISRQNGLPDDVLTMIVRLLLDRNILRKCESIGAARNSIESREEKPYETWNSGAHFERRPDDVYIVTYPKSGTTWMQMILYQLMTDGDLSRLSHIYEFAPYVAWEVPKIGQKRLDALPSPRVLKSHRGKSLYTRDSGKFIYVARNGMDVAVSEYRNQVELDWLPIDFDLYFDRFMSSGDRSWFQHVSDWWDLRDQPNVLFLTYEELQKDLRGAITRIAGFCGLALDERTLERAARNSSFEFMKAHEAKFDHFNALSWFRELMPREGFIRKGKVGSGKLSLTRDQQQRFLREYQRMLSRISVDLRGR